MAIVNLLGSVTPGLQLGLGVRRQVEQKKSQALGRQQQEILGGFRRTALGLRRGERQDVRRQVAEFGPEAIAQLDKTLAQFDAPQLETLKQNNQLIASIGIGLQDVPNDQLPSALENAAITAERRQNPQLAQRLRSMIPVAQSDPDAAKQQIGFGISSAREVEKVIASRESAEKRVLDQSQKELDTELKKSKTTFDQIDKLRSRATALSKDFVKVRDANNRIEAVFAIDKTTIDDFAKKFTTFNPEQAAKFKGNVEAFGDLALIFNFMKMLDPGSTVREGEFATAQNTGGVPDRIVNLYQNVLNGARLNKSQRNAIRLQAQSQFKTANKQNEKDLIRVRKSAKAFNLPENQIFDQPIVEEVEAITVPPVVEELEELGGFGDLSPEDKAELIRRSGA